MCGPEEWLSTTEPGLPASFTFFLDVLTRPPAAAERPLRRNCLIFKHIYLMRYFQYALYPIVFIKLFLLKKMIKPKVNKMP